MNIDIKSVIIGIFFTSIVFLLLGITLLEKKISTINTVNDEVLGEVVFLQGQLSSISLAVEGDGIFGSNLHDKLDEIKELIGNDESWKNHDIHKKLDLIKGDLNTLQTLILLN